MSDPKFCKDCKWCERTRVGWFRYEAKSNAWCLHPASRIERPRNIVTGACACNAAA